MLPPSRYWRWGWLPVLIVLGGCLSHDITAPWSLEDNYNGAIYSQAAHNYLRAGLLTTAGVPAVLYFGPLPIPAKAYYVHHPCLLPLAVAGTFAVFGEREWVARLTPILASLLTAGCLWLLVRNCARARAATLATALFAGLPMELHYGEMVNFEPVALLWMMAALLFLRYWQVTGRVLWRNLGLTACFLGLWTEWLGYVFVLILACHFLATARKKEPRLALTLLGMAVVSAALYFIQIRLVNAHAWSDATDAFLFRLSAKSASPAAAFTWSEWANTVGRDLLGLIPPFQWCLAVFGFIHLLSRRFYLEGRRYLAWAAGCLFLLDGAYMIAFRNASYIHDFAGFYFTAPVAIMGGVAVDAAINWAGSIARERALQAAASCGACLILGILITTGYGAALKFDSPFLILDGEQAEAPNLIPDLGRLIAGEFPADAEVLCNFDPYCSNLPYYAQRTIINNLTTAQDWKWAMSRPGRILHGVIWLGAPEAGEILRALPPNCEKRKFSVHGADFCFVK